jgi:hypothetical protein
MVCPQCRADNSGANSYCGSCGATLAHSAQGLPLSGGGRQPISTPERLNDSPRYERRESILRREITILAAGLAFVAASPFGAWYLFFYQRSPAMIVQKFVEADRAGNLTAERQYVSSTWDSRMILSGLQTFRQQAGSSPFDKYRIADVSVNGDSATVDVEVTITAPAAMRPIVPPAAGAPAARNNTVTVGFALIREKGEWKIDPAQTLAGLSGVLLAQSFQQLAPTLGLPQQPQPNGPVIPPPTAPVAPASPSIM